MNSERKEFLLNLGEKIKNGRILNKMTRRELGKQIGCSEANISRWERGIKEPRLMALKKIENALGIKI